MHELSHEKNQFQSQQIWWDVSVSIYFVTASTNRKKKFLYPPPRNKYIFLRSIVIYLGVYVYSLMYIHYVL